MVGKASLNAALAVLKFIGNMANSTSNAMLASTLDNFTLGNMKEALCDIYKKKLDGMGEDEVNKVGHELRKLPEYQRAKKQYVDSAQRKDDAAADAEPLDETCRYMCMFYGKKD